MTSSIDGAATCYLFAHFQSVVTFDAFTSVIIIIARITIDFIRDGHIHPVDLFIEKGDTQWLWLNNILAFLMNHHSLSEEYVDKEINTEEYRIEAFTWFHIVDETWYVIVTHAVETYSIYHIATCSGSSNIEMNKISYQSKTTRDSFNHCAQKTFHIKNILFFLVIPIKQ